MGSGNVTSGKLPKREELELMRDFSLIKDRRLRDRIRQLVNAIAHERDIALEANAAE